MRFFNSIEKQLVLFLGIGFSLLFTGYEIFLGEYIQSKLEDRYDQTLATRSQMFMTLTRIEDGEVELEFADEFTMDFSDPEGPSYFEIWFPTGAVLERSNSLGERDLPRQATLSEWPVFTNIQLDPGGTCRMVEYSFIPQDETKDIEGVYSADIEHAFKICVAQNREEFDAFLKSIDRAFQFSLLFFLIIAFWIIKNALNRGLQPLTEVRNQVSRITPQRLDQKIHLAAPPTELTPIINQVNHLLNEINEAMVRERNFTSNVSHELRTPISELRNLADVGILKQDDPNFNFREYFTDVKSISKEMEQLILILLSLSRCDTKSQIAQKEAVNLSDLSQQQISKSETLFQHKNVTLNYNNPKETWVKSDAQMLGHIISNLFENALTYCAANSEIELEILNEHGYITWDLSNQTEDLAREDLGSMFDRFWRKDPARSDRCNTGLGLSIVKAFSEVLGIHTEVLLDPDNTFHIRLGFSSS